MKIWNKGKVRSTQKGDPKFAQDMSVQFTSLINALLLSSYSPYSLFSFDNLIQSTATKKNV